MFSPTPQNGQNIGNCLKKAAFFGENASLCDFKYSESLSRQSDVWRFLKEIESHVTVVNLADFLCTDNTCLASVEDIFIYNDFGHLSQEGSAYLGKKMNFFQHIVSVKEVINVP